MKDDYCMECSSNKEQYLYLGGYMLVCLCYIYYNIHTLIQQKIKKIKIMYLKRLRVIYVGRSMMEGDISGAFTKILISFI